MTYTYLLMEHDVGGNLQEWVTLMIQLHHRQALHGSTIKTGGRWLHQTSEYCTTCDRALALCWKGTPNQPAQKYRPTARSLRGNFSPPIGPAGYIVLWLHDEANKMLHSNPTG